MVELIKGLKEKNLEIKAAFDALTKEYASLKVKNGKLAEENARLADRVELIEREALKGNGQIDELNQEKALTKIAVDDLLERLKVIDSIVEQQ